MKRLGLIGLGIGGSRVAANLLKAGYSLAVFDIREGAFEDVCRRGAARASSPREVGEKSDAILLSLPSPKEVKEALFGEEGAARGLRRGCMAINLSTIGPKAAIEIGEGLRGIGIEFVDAPVTAPYMGYLAAERGELTVLVGCDEGAFERAKEILSKVGKVVVRVGPVGMGQVVKLANNLMAAINTLGVFESALWAAKHGVDPRALEVLRFGTGDSWALRNRLPRLLERNFEPGFKTSLMHKDMGLFLEEAKELNLFTPLAGLVYQLLQAAKAFGLGEEDWGSIIKVYEAINKVKVGCSGQA
jgi:3-hydroxyisobutyrate dehydrogenase-like beta-hydroxyacid dehydrogenase